MRRLRPSFAPGAAALLAAALVCTPVAAQNAVPPDVAAALEAGGYAAVPMRRHGDAHLTVRMQLNGVPGVFILDTGAGRTVLDRAAQSRFDEGRTPVSGGVATGAGGAGMAIAALPDSRLRIGDHVTAADVKLPEGCELKADPEQIVISILPPRLSEEELAAEAEAAE